jgi:hypothetical protein
VRGRLRGCGKRARVVRKMSKNRMMAKRIIDKETQFDETGRYGVLE